MRISPLFEAAFWKRGAHHELFWDLLDNIEEFVAVDPRSFGELHFRRGDREFWIYESPTLGGRPAVVIVYEIDDENGVVTLWNFTFKPTSRH